jgi:hypothetical protein
MLIKFFVRILIQTTSQHNLQKYYYGNYGSGPDNRVAGANNTWNGV